MKLRNKRTGEIRDFGRAEIISCDPTNSVYDEHFCSLSELNEKWEDAPDEEPKEYWYIAEMCAGLQKKQDTDNGEDRFNKEIGNYFATEEQAEKALKKLKAWKRLKDKGFRFTGHFLGTEGLSIHYECDMKNDISDDLDLLFSGEEG